MSETIDLGGLLAETVAFVRGSIATGIPATVLSYDPANQTITAKPTVSGRRQDPDTGALVPFPLPAIPNVPVAFPSSTGFAHTWPLSPGDTVYLMFADSSLDEWKSTGSADNLPADPRRFDLTDAVAIPGVRPLVKPIPATGYSSVAMVLEGADIRMGSSAATDFVALASKVLAELNKIKAIFDVHTHVSAAPGIPTAIPVPILSPVGTVGAIKVKAE